MRSLTEATADGNFIPCYPCKRKDDSDGDDDDHIAMFWLPCQILDQNSLTVVCVIGGTCIYCIICKVGSKFWG